MTRVAITTHILDLDKGCPATGVQVELLGPDDQIAEAQTDSDGRITQWSQPVELQEGTWTLVFDTGEWFAGQNRNSFFPSVSLAFTVSDVGQHYHVPLLLNGYGYSTYRGS